MTKDFGGSSNGRSDSSSVGLDTAADASISGSAASASSSVGGPLAMGATAAAVSSASAVVGSAGGGGGIELREMDHKKTLLQRGMMGDSREMATNICRQYIRSSSRYFLLDHLPDIGSYFVFICTFSNVLSSYTQQVQIRISMVTDKLILYNMK